MKRIRSYGESDLIEIAVILVGESEKAWKVDAGGEKPAWLPKSQCEFEDGTLTLPEWLAKEKGLI
jgi:hypothetical protein